MNESLRIHLGSVSHAACDVWLIDYRADIDTPASWREIETCGWSQVNTTERIEDKQTLGEAVSFAKAWALDSGYKVSAPKIEGHGNNVTIRLRRP